MTTNKIPFAELEPGTRIHLADGRVVTFKRVAGANEWEGTSIGDDGTPSEETFSFDHAIKVAEGGDATDEDE